MSIFGIFIIPLFIILAIVIGIVITCSRLLMQLFGFGMNRGNGQHTGRQNMSGGDASSDSSHSHTSRCTPSGRKIISDDEGEYVDFEEVR